MSIPVFNCRIPAILLTTSHLLAPSYSGSIGPASTLTLSLGMLNTDLSSTPIFLSVPRRSLRLYAREYLAGTHFAEQKKITLKYHWVHGKYPV